MKEIEIEQKLVKAVADRMGWCLKWTSQSLTGIPDRIVLLPGGKIAFVEVKAPGEKPRKLQIRRMNQLQALGFNCYVLDKAEDIPALLEEIADEV
ncbi:VRR-NUC domain-containing protein [Eremococcus coleocola]|uniref:VRR-NUC domain-containing protein n=1 Tax=Eremococcus coleocola TaxID=88132 RepID=UPI000424043C|nr:VRR-NUC domain-containing protein [Eremococcus coleocola]